MVVGAPPTRSRSTLTALLGSPWTAGCEHCSGNHRVPGEQPPSQATLQWLLSFLSSVFNVTAVAAWAGEGEPTVIPACSL